MDNIKIKIEELLKIIEKFINYKIDTIEFKEIYENKYEELFLINEKAAINYIGEKMAYLFDDIHTEINFFEPYEKLRKEHKNYIDEKQLLNNVKIVYNKIKKKLPK